MTDRVMVSSVVPNRGLNALLRLMLTALAARDKETAGHTERVTAYSVRLVRWYGLRWSTVRAIRYGALLHDIGKIGVPDSILHKQGPLTELEWEEMRKHPVLGYEMCRQTGCLHEAGQIVLHHHEHWDGSGYPHGLAGGGIPLGARLFAVVDAFDAMTSHRPYRTAISFAEAQEEIRQQSGKQFAPQMVAAFQSVPQRHWQRWRGESADEIAMSLPDNYANQARSVSTCKRMVAMMAATRSHSSWVPE